MAVMDSLSADDLAQIAALGGQIGQIDADTKRQLALAQAMREGIGGPNQRQVAGRNFGPTALDVIAHGLLQKKMMDKMSSAMDQQSQVPGLQNKQMQILMAHLLKKRGLPQTGQALDTSSPSATGVYDPYTQYREPDLR
jgi:hypothetical protein